MFPILVLFACAHTPPTWSVEGVLPTIDALRAGGVGLTPVVFVMDLPAPHVVVTGPTRLEESVQLLHLPSATVLDPNDSREGSFLRNEFVGNVRFGGGVVRTGEVALEVRARIVELGQDEIYRAQAARWLTGVAGSALADAGIDTLPLTLDALPALERVPLRGVHPLDGHDNLNLPRRRLRAGPLAPRADGPRWAVVPFVRSYLSHNGGWFLGQEWGTSGGARLEAAIIVYDLRTGAPVRQVWATGRVVSEMDGQPSGARLDQYLLDAEKDAARRLDATFE
jgi:hypothetical protein